MYVHIVACVGPRIWTLNGAKEAALAYLAERYPALQWGDLTTLRLNGGWLVETVGLPCDDDEFVPERASLQVRALLLVSSRGTVDEVEAGNLARRAAYRGLAAVQTLES